MIAPKVLVGWLVIGIVIGGCSEKQKDAARLEAAMKNGDSVVVPEYTGPTDSVVRGQFDSAVAEISAQAVMMTSQPQVDSQKSLSSTDSSESTSYSATSDTGLGESMADSNMSQSLEPIMDAGAVPREEMPKAKVASPAVATPSEPEGTAGGFVVQVVSTPDAAEAATLVAKFSKNGYRAFSMTVEVDGSTYHRVRIGRYATIAEAEAALDELHQKFKVSGFVATVK